MHIFTSRPLRKLMTGVGVATTALIALTGCVASTEGSPEALFDYTTAIEASWSKPVTLASNPAAAGDNIVSYVLDETGALKVVAWSGKSGEEIWRSPASTGGAPRGVALTPGIVEFESEFYATFVRLSADPEYREKEWTDLVVKNISNGEELKLNNTDVWVAQRPDACSIGAEDQVCFTGTFADSYDDGRNAYRIDVGTGRITKDESSKPPAGSRYLGTTVYSTNDRPATGGTEMLGRHVGELQWERPYTDVFGESTSSDAGWVWDEDSATVLGVGYVHDPSWFEGDTYTRDVGLHKVVALDAETGETQWEIDRATYCDYEVWYEVPDVVPVCVYNTGTETGLKNDLGLYERTYVDLNVEMVGIDSVTGEKVWTSPLGDISEILGGAFGSPSLVSTPDHFFYLVNGTWFEIDIASGDQTKLPEDGIYGCQEGRELKVDIPNNDDGPVTQSMGSNRFGCHPDLSPVTAGTVSAGALETIGAELTGGRWVVGTAEGLSVYTVAK